MSFWDDAEQSNEDSYRQNFTYERMMRIIRDVAGNLVRSVELIDTHRCENYNQLSLCYRQVYQSTYQALTYELSHKLQSAIRLQLAAKLNITLR